MRTRPVGEDRHRAESEIDLARECRRDASIRLHDDEFGLAEVAEEVLGDLARRIDLEADEGAVIVDISERRRGAVGRDD
jgi:hypothetical protein